MDSLEQFIKKEFWMSQIAEIAQKDIEILPFLRELHLDVYDIFKDYHCDISEIIEDGGFIPQDVENCESLGKYVERCTATAILYTCMNIRNAMQVKGGGNHAHTNIL